MVWGVGAVVSACDAPLWIGGCFPTCGGLAVVAGSATIVGWEEPVTESGRAEYDPGEDS